MTTSIATATSEATTTATATATSTASLKPTTTPKKQMTPATTTNSPPVEPSPYGNVDDLVIKTNERVRWTEELHEIFVKTTLKLGPKAVPSRILSEMNCKQLTREQVASHLQNYRSILFPPASGTQDKKAPATPKKNTKAGQTTAAAAAGKRKLEENAIQPKGSSRKKQKAQKPTQTKISPQPTRVVVKTETAPKAVTQPAPVPTILAASPIPAEFQFAPSNEQHAFVNSFLSEELFAATSNNVGGCTAGSCAFEHQFVEGRLALLQSGDHEGRLDFSSETQPSIQRQEEPSSTERHEERVHSMVEVEEDLFSPSSSCASSPYSSPEPVAPIPKSQPFFNILSSETAPFEMDFPAAPSTRAAATTNSELVELQLSLDDFFSNFQHSASQVGTGSSTTTEFPFFEMGSAEPNPCFCCPTIGSAKTIEI